MYVYMHARQSITKRAIAAIESGNGPVLGALMVCGWFGWVSRVARFALRRPVGRECADTRMRVARF